MKTSGEKNSQMSPQEMGKVLSSPEGKRLLAMLSESGGLNRAIEAFKKGDMKGVQAALQPAMEKPETAELLGKINGK